MAEAAVAPSGPPSQPPDTAAVPSNPHLATPTPSDSESPAAPKQPQGAQDKPRAYPAHSIASPAFASPLPSRESSPARPSQRQRTAPQAATTATTSNSNSSSSSITAAQQRRNSADPSPTRNPPSLSGVQTTTPSAAAIQRALSATTTPQLQPTTTASAGTEPSSKLPRATARPAVSTTAAAPAGGGGDADDATAGTAASVKSPPVPAHSSNSDARRTSPNKANTTKKQDPPSIVVQASTPVSTTPEMKGKDGGSLVGPGQGTAPQQQQQPVRPSRTERGPSGAPSLATVEEGSNPSTPSTEVGEGESLTRKSTVIHIPHPTADTPQPSSSAELSGSEQPAKLTESGSDSASNKPKTPKADDKKTHDPDRTPRASTKTVQPKSSYQSLASLKPKSAAEPSSRKMTVETETVSSAGQSGVSAADRAASSKAEGSLRLKPSNETIRPKRERKKTRKAPSLNSGTASSKADLFEAKVASAVDDVNSSDSDETFVYESNPPDSQPRRSRHHSRTPSAASLQSTADPRTGLRSLTGVLNGDRGVSGKRSMKFANNPYSSSGADDDVTLGGQEGTRGGLIRPSAGSGVHHHHMRGHNRGGFGGANYAAEEESGTSPYSLANKRSGTNSRNTSQPSSPRFGNNASRMYNGTSRKNEVYNTYDLDADGADDERTPLMGTVRTPRSSRTGRLPGNVRLRQLERSEHPRSYWIKRFAGCAIMVIMIALVVLGAIGFFFVTTKPLYDVDVRAIKNVLASEQEIMFDLQVEAVNPNLMAIAINDMDVNVFAKSKYTGSEKWWRDHGKPPPPPAAESPLTKRHSISQRRREQSTADESDTADAASWFDFPGWKGDDTDTNDSGGYNPPGPGGDQQMLLLGRVLHFDNALTFDGSPIKRHPRRSVGELRVPHPANKTEAGGTERWERVLQHPFQLVVKGILKYSLPLSTHVIAAPIDAAVMVKPEEGPDGDVEFLLSPLLIDGLLDVDGEEVVVVGDGEPGLGLERAPAQLRSAKFRLTA